MVKKIGILTLPPIYNYGNILQIYALQYVINDMGYEAVLINRNPQRNRLSYIKNRISVFVADLLKLRKGYFYSDRNVKLVSLKTRKFIIENIKQTQLCKSNKELYEITKDFHAIIVGSDQVWRVSNDDDICIYFLDPKIFDRKILRISYAASFGVDRWLENSVQTKKCINLLKNFAGISVREKSGVDICKKMFGIDAIQVIDPTLLLDCSVYKNILSGISVDKRISRKDIMCYILDNSSMKKLIIDEISRILQCEYYYFLPKQKSSLYDNVKMKNCMYPSVEEWIYSFYSSPFIITDSFHGCVFSIIFNKSFWVIANPQRGLSRITSLLTMFGLQDRLISSPKEIVLEKIRKEINWHKVNRIKEQLREKGREYLSQRINTTI